MLMRYGCPLFSQLFNCCDQCKKFVTNLVYLHSIKYYRLVNKARRMSDSSVNDETNPDRAYYSRTRRL